MTDPAGILVGVADLTTNAFESALATLAKGVHPGDVVEVLSSCLTALAAAGGPSARERDRRVRLLLSTLSPSMDQLRELATRARASAPSILNSLRAALPPELRTFAVLQPAPPAQAEHAVREAIDGAGVSLNVANRAANVVLVGTADEHANNAALLDSGGLHPIRVNDIDSLLHIAPDGICGFVIAPSAWVGHDMNVQRRLVECACSLSTFVFVRIATDGLAPAVAASVHDIAADVLCGPAEARRFCHASDCGLTPADVVTMHRAATLLESADSAGFLPLDATDTETCLLRLVASERRGRARGSAIRMTELGGGRSGAKLFLLQPTGARPFVVKLGTPAVLSDELRRHQRWIAEWETQVTAPSLHLHMGAAAVSYRLQTAAEAPERPAPTLEDRIEKLVASEWVRDSNADGIARDLEGTLRAAAGRLAALNRRVADGSGPMFWLDWPAKGLAERGIDVRVANVGGRAVGAAELCHVAMERLAPFAYRGVVHGDIHGRNILLVDGAPAFIDYTYSGPGHPLVDLVRLDACVRAVAMRASIDEAELTTLFRSIYVEGLSAEDLIARVGAGVSTSSRLAIRCAFTARARALEVAAAHGAGLPEYLSMVAVVSAFLLSVRSPGSAIERACLRAVAPEILNGRSTIS